MKPWQSLWTFYCAGLFHLEDWKSTIYSLIPFEFERENVKAGRCILERQGCGYRVPLLFPSSWGCLFCFPGSFCLREIEIWIGLGFKYKAKVTAFVELLQDTCFLFFIYIKNGNYNKNLQGNNQRNFIFIVTKKKKKFIFIRKTEITTKRIQTSFSYGKKINSLLFL